MAPISLAPLDQAAVMLHLQHSSTSILKWTNPQDNLSAQTSSSSLSVQLLAAWNITSPAPHSIIEQSKLQKVRKKSCHSSAGSYAQKQYQNQSPNHFNVSFRNEHHHFIQSWWVKGSRESNSTIKSRKQAAINRTHPYVLCNTIQSRYMNTYKYCWQLSWQLICNHKALISISMAWSFFRAYTEITIIRTSF